MCLNVFCWVLIWFLVVYGGGLVFGVFFVLFKLKIALTLKF